MAILESLFSSVAIVFALIAIIFQGKELKESTEAQRQQADALLTQIEEQKKQSNALAQQLACQDNSNRIRAYSAQLQYLQAEIRYLDEKIHEVVQRIENDQGQHSSEDTSQRWELVRNMRNKVNNYRAQAHTINEKITQLLAL